MTKDEVIERLKELAIKLGTPRLRKEDIRPGLYYHLQKNFTGGISAALIEAGLEPTDLAKKMATKNEDLLIYLVGLGKKLGKRPTIMDVRRDGKYWDKIFNRFGGVQKAYKLAINNLKSETTKEEKEVFLKDFPYSPLFLGKAGEFYIVAELMYRGYNANLLPVDLGIDVTAIKDNKTFYFQVKNVSFDVTTRRTIQITMSAFLRNQSSNMFYMFVLQRGLEKKVLILSYQKIHELIRKNFIPFNKESKDFSICISLNDKVVNIHLPSDKKMSENVSNFLDDWDIIV